jgi:hypothetical protein
MEKVVDSFEEFVAKYSEDQPRDERGQFSSDEGAGSGDKKVVPWSRRVSDAKKYGYTTPVVNHGIIGTTTLANSKTGVAVTLSPNIDNKVDGDRWYAYDKNIHMVGSGTTHASFIAWAEAQKK